jgi:energy-coupling factor transporter transmembrane protein EcfT
VLGWVAVETRGFRPEVIERQPELRMRVADAALVALAAAPVATLFA